MHKLTIERLARDLKDYSPIKYQYPALLMRQYRPCYPWESWVFGSMHLNETIISCLN
jgi:hypothetical protein